MVAQSVVISGSRTVGTAFLDLEEVIAGALAEAQRTAEAREDVDPGAQARLPVASCTACTSSPAAPSQIPVDSRTSSTPGSRRWPAHASGPGDAPA
jgi:hypothetical protein